MKFKESETLELKKSTSELKEGVIAIASILNKHRHGKLCFGIRNDGTIAGQRIGGDTIREISTAISDHIEPKIYPKIRELSIRGKTCIEVEFSGNEVPYFAYGRAYIRTGDENRQLSRAELERIMLGRSGDGAKWDSQPCREAKITDLSAKKARAFLKKAGLEYSTTESAMKKLGLLKSGKPLNTAVLLFAHHPEKFFRNAKLRCAVFPSEDTATIVDRQEYAGDIFYLIQKAEEYLITNIHIGMRLEGLYRVDVPEIDKAAMREAVINAFCHRDYSEQDSVNIAVFRNRVEIRSPGLLYGGLTLEKIRKEMVSERRNELLAEMLHRVHYIEKWGRGIKLMLSKEPKTSFKEIGRQFIVAFPRKAAAIQIPAGGVTEKVPKKVTIKVPKKVTQNQLRIIEEISKNPHITSRELAALIGISERKTKTNISKLKQKKLLKRIGPRKGGHWEAKA